MSDQKRPDRVNDSGAFALGLMVGSLMVWAEKGTDLFYLLVQRNTWGQVYTFDKRPDCSIGQNGMVRSLRAHFPGAFYHAQ